jgi:hypothetical protein
MFASKLSPELADHRLIWPVRMSGRGGYMIEKTAEMGKFELAEAELKTLRDLGSDEADELEEFIQKMKNK